MEKTSPQLTFTKDKLVMFLAIIDGFLIVLGVVISIIRLHSHDFKIPVQYVVADGSITQSANWYSLYSLTAFMLLCGIATIFLAHRMYRGNRLFAAGVLLIYLVVAFVSLLIMGALLGLVGRV